MDTLITQIADAVTCENGTNLAYILRPTSPHGKDLVKLFRNPTREGLHTYKGSIVGPWDEVAIQYVLVCTQIAKKRFEDAFKEQAQLISLFSTFFVKNNGWTLPALFSMLRDLRDLAIDADFHSKYNGKKSECMEEAARIVARAFGNCMADRTSAPGESRKWGVYYIAGLVLKCYFRLKRISLSKSILRAIGAAVTDIPALELYPKSHQVAFRYYLGMISFLNEEYAKAEQELTLAFYQCHIEAHSNHQRILTYLLPLRILRGHLPSDELMQRFPILREIFAPFVIAIKAGDIAAFDIALDRWEKRLVELNLWLTLEKARELWVASNKNTRIPISMFHCSLRISKMDVSQEEAECLVANMIYKGFMRGYISHEKQTVVLAGTNAFPRLADRQSPFSLM